MYSISEMAEKLNISIQTLRNWDKNGTLVAKRKPSGHRFYTNEQFLKAAGKEKYIAGGTDLDAVRGKIVLITGGTGTLGNALTERIHSIAKKIIIFSRGELKQAEMQEKFARKENIRFMIGDIRDKDRLMFALHNVEVCVHAACMKRVDACSYNPFEAVKNNIIGSMNIVEACIENGIKRALMVSSDKACSAATLYGGTKFVAEQLFINGNNYSKRDGTIFMASRYGNVMGSNGSFRTTIETQAKNGKIKITHKDMTRFFMSIDEAVNLNLFALNNSIGGEIFIPKLKASSLLQFAKAFAPNIPIEFVGIRGYEKIHEDLISDTEMLYTVDCDDYYKILPPPDTCGVGTKWDINYPKEPVIKPFRYSSDKVEKLTTEELREL